jgi:NodT family efflux transporter outer membrane factor (OMF) lipoprotein
VDLTSYWTGFNDPALNRLVAEAVAHNYTIQAARDRIAAAAATGSGANATLLPDLGAIGGLQEGKLSSIGKQLPGPSPARLTGLASLDASWTLPLFGRFAATHQAAASLLDLASAARQAAQVEIVAQVANAYISLRADQQQQSLLQAELAGSRHIVDLVEIQANAGIASDLDVARAQNHTDELSLRLPGVALNIVMDVLHLAALQGQLSPDDSLLIAAPLPAAPPAPDLIPADLLRLRPQIIEAEAAVAANAANLGIANADLYPQFTLGGSISVLSGAGILNPLTLVKLPNTLALSEGGAGVTVPLLDWGARYDSARAAQAGLAASIEDYHEAVVEGVIAVDIGLASITAAREEVVASAREQQSALGALNAAQILFGHGLTSLSDLLNAEQAREKADMDATSAAAAADSATINLYAEIGGGALRGS